MKFIIFISDTIRHGNFPRIDGFSYSMDHDKYLYEGRELTVGEFNDAAKTVFSPEFRNQGFTFLVQAVGPEIEAQIAKDKAEAAEMLAAANKAAKKAAAVAAVDEQVIAPDPAAPEFSFEGRHIFQGGVRVAGLFGEDSQLRVRAEHANLRPAIEAWLSANPQ